jgi:hypothetical protein
MYRFNADPVEEDLKRYDTDGVNKEYIMTVLDPFNNIERRPQP